MSDDKPKPALDDAATEDNKVVLFDPFSHHFVSQNRKSDFLKSLEDMPPDEFYGTIH